MIGADVSGFVCTAAVSANGAARARTTRANPVATSRRLVFIFLWSVVSGGFERGARRARVAEQQLDVLRRKDFSRTQRDSLQLHGADLVTAQRLHIVAE